VNGEEVFRLYDSLGVPFDFAEDLAGQRGLTIDRQAYEAAMEGQRGRARASSKFGAGAQVAAKVEQQGDDRFVGYDRVTEPDVEVVALHPASDSGAELFAFLDRTPFYAESGGQISDTGELTTAAGLRARIVGVRKPSLDSCGRTP
jgi:alanyl-tRNA synthetase